jgi:hypothetical protein
MRIGQLATWTDPRGTFGTQQVRIKEWRSPTEALVQLESNGMSFAVRAEDLKPMDPA